MLRATILLVGAALLPFVASSQELLVFPALTDETPGLYSSVWLTQAMVVKVNPLDTVTLRRRWVCTPGGGFADDPDNAPAWQLGGAYPPARVAVLSGHDLLANSGRSTGAVGLEVEGGPVLAHAHVADASRGVSLPGVVFGQGQLIPAFREPLRGPSHIPWLGGCRTSPCAQTPPAEWNYLRNNVGIVNPNSAPLTVQATVIPFALAGNPLGRFDEVWWDDPETFEIDVLPYGWVQVPWASTRPPSSYPWIQYGAPIGFIISLTPEPDLPYYAYASVVFTPDPESGVPLFSDPMYVPAEPGYVVPFAEAAFPQ